MVLTCSVVIVALITLAAGPGLVISKEVGEPNPARFASEALAFREDGGQGARSLVEPVEPGSDLAPATSETATPAQSDGGEPSSAPDTAEGASVVAAGASATPAPEGPGALPQPSTSGPGAAPKPKPEPDPKPAPDPDPAVTPAPPTGQVLHVRAGANGSGTETSPFGSVAAAIDRVSAGGTVLVHDGSYTTINVSKSGTAGAYITIAAAPGESPKLSPGQHDHAAVQLDGVHHVEVRGFEMVGIGREDDGGVSIRFGSHDVRVVGNRIHDFPGNGIEVIEAGGVEILSNRVYGNSRRSKYQTSGISVFTAKGTDGPGWDNVISGNIVYDNYNDVRSFSGAITDGNCIIIDYNKQFGYTGGFLVSNNVCTNNGGRGIHVFHSSNVLVINNTLYRNLTHPEINDGELTAVEAQNVTFRNNLVWSTDGANDIHLWKVDGLVADNNVIVGEKRDQSGGPNPTIADAQLQNPNTAPSSGDFRPRAGSPLIGSGSTDGAPSTDLRGTARSDPPTVGALER